jgi:choline dehydrogenase-like flavoprotein
MKESNRLAALRAICNAFIPALDHPGDPQGYWRRKASDILVPEKILDLIARAKAEDRQAFNQLLWLLGSPLLGLTWGGPLRGAHRLNQEQCTRLLHQWAHSRLPDLRNAYNTLRKLSAFLFFGDTTPDGADNPNWPTLDYAPLPGPPPADPTPLPLIPPTPVMTCEVLVIGSGAGGSIVAAQLAAAGKEVLILEKGHYSPTHTFTQREFPMLHRHFEAGALLSSKNGSITLLAGSTVGGGTSINWAACLQTPDEVLHEWATEHHNPHFLDPAYKKGFDFVARRNSIRTDIAHNPQNALLLEGAKKLGYQAGNIPMNLVFPENIPPHDAWQQAGFSCLGDAYGIKQGAAQTFLHDACTHGARIAANIQVDKIVLRNGAACGALARYTDATGQIQSVEIRAEKVVLSAGALHTPVLLLKSGIRHPHIGRNLFLHPVVAMPGIYAQETRPWFGPMMSAVVTEFARLDGPYGVRIECPPVHPGLGAFALSWENGPAFKQEILQLKHTAVFLALVRDKFGGQVRVGPRSGEPEIHYNLHPFDRAHLIRGMQEMARLHLAAGAERLTVLHNCPQHFYNGVDHPEEISRKIAEKPWGLNHFSLFSAHQMGTARMGGTAEYPVQPDGAVRGVGNLYVADTSLFPAASGTNPMFSAQALAYYVAQQIK